MRTVIQNGRVITPEHIIDHGGVVFEDGKIVSVFEGEYCGVAERFITAGGNYVSPGFIDIHTHGGGGHDFMDGTANAFIRAAKMHLKHGTTSIVPTTLTCSDDELFCVLECYKQAKREIKNGPVFLGLHLEGPYFSSMQSGAQDTRYLRNPSPEHYMSILEYASDIIRVSAAIELSGALILGDELKKRSIVASIGHSDALYEDVCMAVEHGYRLVTHLYSAMSSLRRIGPWRHLGIVESAYLMDELDVEIIADGCHLPQELLRYITKLMPLHKICLVTDSMRGAGLPQGSIVKLGSKTNGQDVILEDGVAMLMDRSAFAGSICTSDRCVRTMINLAGVSVIDAVRMMTANPARVIGASTKGALVTGMDADICVFNDDIDIRKVIVGGEVCYSSSVS